MIDYAGIYEKLYRKGYQQQRKGIFDKILTSWLVDNLEFSSVLDIGCGRGEALKYLNKYNKITTGIDVAQRAVNRCIEEELNVVLGSALSLPFPDSSFDLVKSYDFMEHIAPDDLHKVISEQVRTTKKYIAHDICCRLAKREKWNSIAGMNLHLSVKDIDEWTSVFESFKGLKLVFKESNNNDDRFIIVYEKVS